MALVTITGPAYENFGGVGGALIPSGTVVFEPISLDEPADIVDSAKKVHAVITSTGFYILGTTNQVKLWPGIWLVTLPDKETFEVGMTSGSTYSLVQLRTLGQAPGTHPPFSTLQSLIVPGTITEGFIFTKNGTTVSGLDPNTYPTTEQAVLKSLIDAKGDILAGSENDTIVRLPVGANGKILKADSSAASGLSWTNDPFPPAYLTAVNTSTQTIPTTAFTTVAFPTPSVNVGGTWNAPSSTWTIPYTGRYYFYGSIRANDNLPVRQVGLNVSEATGDGPTGIWRNYPLGIRDTYFVTGESDYTAGQQVRMSLFSENAAITLQNATLKIRRVV